MSSVCGVPPGLSRAEEERSLPGPREEGGKKEKKGKESSRHNDDVCLNSFYVE